jgi:hypothetical protein
VTNSPGIIQLPLAETKMRNTVEPRRKSLRRRIPKKQWGMYTDDRSECSRIIPNTATVYQAPEFIYYEPKTMKETMESSEAKL